MNWFVWVRKKVFYLKLDLELVNLRIFFFFKNSSGYIIVIYGNWDALLLFFFFYVYVEYPDLAYGFNWLLKLRCGYRFDIA